MFTIPDLSAFFSMAVGAIVALIGLVLATVIGFWIDLPSWSYLASAVIPGVVAGICFHIRAW